MADSQIPPIPKFTRRMALASAFFTLFMAALLAFQWWQQQQFAPLRDAYRAASTGYGLELEREYSRLGRKINDAISRGAPLPLGEFALQAELLKSQVELLETGSGAASVRTSGVYLSSVPRLVQTLDQVADRVQQGDTNLATWRAILKELDALEAGIHAVSSRVDVDVKAVHAQLLDHMVDVNRSVVWMMALQVVLFGVSALVLWLRAHAESKEKRALRQLADDLARANEQAMEASRGKSKFLANMSHELRTPLNGMLGMLGLLEGTRIDATQQDYIITARNSARHLLTLLNDVLDLSSFDAGKFQLKLDTMHLLGAMYEVESVMRPLAEDKQLELRLQVAPDVPRWVIGDHTRIKQIVLNLVSNAIKFSDAGAVTVRLSCDESRSSKVNRTVGLLIEVIDQGIGIDPDVCERLFRRFEQGDSGTARRSEGTGLGLEISRGLARRMQGDISVKSVKGKGSVFSVTLILQIGQEPTPSIAPTPTLFEIEQPSATEVTISSLDILVADDNSTNRKYMGTLLGSMGHEVRFAADGEEAVAQVHRQLPDLVLMDLHMPVMDGFDATLQLRQVPGPAADIPIVALTADIWDETRQRAQSVGMNDFLTKPIDTLALEDCLAKQFPGLMSPVRVEVAAPNAVAGDVNKVQLFGPVPQKMRASEVSGRINLALVGEVCVVMGRSMYSELVLDFGRPGVGNLARLLNALAEFEPGQEKALQEIAHSVKGEAAGLGLQRLSDAAREVEYAAPELTMQSTSVLAQDVRDNWDIAMVLLEKMGFVETLSAPL